MERATHGMTLPMRAARLLLFAAAMVPMLVIALLLMPFALICHEHGPDRERLARERRATERWRCDTLRPRLGSTTNLGKEAA